MSIMSTEASKIAQSEGYAPETSFRQQHSILSGFSSSSMLNSSNNTTANAEPRGITFRQRMISACSGSLLTSLLVTPFDVIRIRIQQQEILQQNECCQQGRFQPPVSKLVKEYSTKSFAAVKEVANTSPEIFWQHKEFCESAKDCSKITSTTQGFALITRNEGILTLWRGLSLTLVMAVPSNIIYFTGYEHIRDHSPIKLHPLNPLLCGSLARIMAATFVSPLELIKTRLQSIPSAKSVSGVPANNILADLLKDLWNTVRQQGVRVLFTGLQLTLWRDVPFSGVYWLCYEFFKKRTGEFASTNHYTKDVNDELKVISTSFISGSISGFLAALVTNPFDVGKTRMQITSHEAEKNGAKRVKEPSMFRFMADIYRKEGLNALYAGFGPRAMKIVPSCAIMISTYEIGKKFFHTTN